MLKDLSYRFLEFAVFPMGDAIERALSIAKSGCGNTQWM